MVLTKSMVGTIYYMQFAALVLVGKTLAVGVWNNAVVSAVDNAKLTCKLSGCVVDRQSLGYLNVVTAKFKVASILKVSKSNTSSL